MPEADTGSHHGPGLSGEVVDFYHKYRRGYPAGVFDVLARTLNPTEDDIAVDLGCGTGQISVPLAESGSARSSPWTRQPAC